MVRVVAIAMQVEIAVRPMPARLIAVCREMRLLQSQSGCVQYRYERKTNGRLRDPASWLHLATAAAVGVTSLDLAIGLFLMSVQHVH